MNIGIDLGGTIFHRAAGKAFDNSIGVIKKLINRGDNIYIISRVNSEQRERSLKWLSDTDFFNQTGINKDNLYYCWDRRDKSIFAKALNISVFIDDRAEVMYYMNPLIVKFLINPPKQDLIEYEGKLINTMIVKDWFEIEEKFI